MFQQFSSRLTHFLLLFTCFFNILDYLPCSWLLSFFCLFAQLFVYPAVASFSSVNEHWFLCWFTILSSSGPSHPTGVPLPQENILPDLQTTLHAKLFPSYIVHIKTCPKNANFKKYLQGEASKPKLGMWLRGEKFRTGLSETDISELNFEDWAEVGYVHGTEEKAFLPERAAWAKAQRGERRTSEKCK